METDTYKMTIMCEGVTGPWGHWRKVGQTLLLGKRQFPQRLRESLQTEGIVPAKAQDLERACRSNVVKPPHLRGPQGAEFRTGNGPLSGHGTQGPPGSSQVWAQGNEWREAWKQEVDASSLPTAAGPALPLGSREVNGTAPALFSAC